MSIGTISNNNIQRCSTGSCEEFRDIPGWEGYYQVSNIGTVRSIDRTVVSVTGKIYNRKGKVIKQRLSEDGYKVVSIGKNAHDITMGVHRAMALAFIPNPENKPMVNHLNSIRTDNRLDNFEWCTNAENIQHSFDMGISSNKGEKHPRAIFTMEKVRAIREELSKGKTPLEVANMFNVKRRNIYAIRDGQNWNYP